MKETKNIIITGDGGREDILSMFDSLVKYANLFFLIYNKEIVNRNLTLYKKYGTVIIWENYKNAFSLIEKVKVSSIVYLQFGDYNEIALRVAAKEKKIPTFMLSHGFLDPENYDTIKNNTILESLSIKHSFKTTFLGRFLSKHLAHFYFNTSNVSSHENKRFLSQFYEIRSKHTMLETFDLLEHQNLDLDTYICFNKNCKNWYIKKHKTKEEQCKLIGVPYYDSFFALKTVELSFDNIIFIDQPFYEQSLLGWSEKKKAFFIEELIHATKKHKLFIKEHPLGNSKFWGRFSNQITIIKEQDWLKLLAESTIFVGFYSTLLMPIAAMKDKVVFTFENHPEEYSENLLSNFLTEPGVASQCNSVNDLENKLQNIVKIFNYQNSKKEFFIKNYMHTFDGKSKDRLVKILVANETV